MNEKIKQNQMNFDTKYKIDWIHYLHINTFSSKYKINTR